MRTVYKMPTWDTIFVNLLRLTSRLINAHKSHSHHVLCVWLKKKMHQIAPNTDYSRMFFSNSENQHRRYLPCLTDLPMPCPRQTQDPHARLQERMESVSRTPVNSRLF